MENNANQLNSMLCKRNCGFFGNAAYDGYCSKCYKDHVKRQNSGSAAGRVTPTSGLPQPTPPPTQSTAPILADIHLTAETSTSQSSMVVEPTIVTTSTTQPIAIPTRNAPSSEHQQQTVSSSPSGAAGDTVQPVQQGQLKFGVESIISASCMEQVAMPPPSTTTSMASTAVNNQLSTSLMSTDESLMSTSLPASCSTQSGASGITPPTTEKKKRTRCCVESCKRKVGLTGFDCRCGGLYCWEHRYSDKHDCKFDYKELGQDQIRKNNPIVVGEKIQKI